MRTSSHSSKGRQSSKEQGTEACFAPGRDRDSLRAIGGAELLQDVLHMRLHRLFRNEETIGDIPISISCCFPSVTPNRDPDHRELAVDHLFRFAERCEYLGVIGDAHRDDPTREIPDIAQGDV
jgi:hypothetical protein